MKLKIQNKNNLKETNINMLKFLYKKLAFQAIGLVLLIFLNLDSNTFCETIETFDEVKETPVEKSWSDWLWDNKVKILIITGVAVGIVIGYYYFNDQTNLDIDIDQTNL